MRYLCTVCLFLVLGPAIAHGIVEKTDDKNGDGNPDSWIVREEGNIICLKVDTDFDGQVDYLLRTDEDNKKIYEEIDFNHDGSLDDYYYYVDGILDRRELDSNYDGDVDIWVYLYKGIYIRKYARDTDYDGVVDVEKDYTPEGEE